MISGPKSFVVFQRTWPKEAQNKMHVYNLKRNMFGGVRIYFVWGDVSKVEKMVLCQFPPQI